jgi:hypothetical protein
MSGKAISRDVRGSLERMVSSGRQCDVWDPWVLQRRVQRRLGYFGSFILKVLQFSVGIISPMDWRCLEMW